MTTDEREIPRPFADLTLYSILKIVALIALPVNLALLGIAWVILTAVGACR